MLSGFPYQPHIKAKIVEGGDLFAQHFIHRKQMP